MNRIMKRILTFLLCFLMVFTTVLPVFAGTTVQKDYASHWAKDTIDKALATGLVSGYPDGTFKPNHSITRAEFMTVVNNAYNFTEMSEIKFNDVSSTSWYAKEVSMAAAAGYVTAVDGGVDPLRAITRAEVAEMIARANNFIAASLENRFEDHINISDESKPYINAVSEKKIMTGTPEGNFLPLEDITRAEAVVTLTRALAYEDKITITYDKGIVYGTSAYKRTIEGNVLVTADGASLQNMIIKGNLTIAKEVGEGDVTLRNVEVQGATLVYGGGENSIHLIDSSLKAVYVNKPASAVRLLATGSTVVDDVVVRSAVKLQESKLTGTGFGRVVVEKGLPTTQKITVQLIGTQCSEVAVKGMGAILTVDIHSSIEKLNIQGERVIVKGTGKIAMASVSANRVTFEKKPASIDVAAGIKAPIIKAPTVASSSSTGSSGSSGGRKSSGGSSNGGSTPTPVPANEVTVSNAVEFANAFDNNSKTKITLSSNIGATILDSKRTNSVTINFNGHNVTGNLEITAKNISKVTLNGASSETIEGNFTVDAARASIVNNVKVKGTAIIKEVSYSSYQANDVHNSGIEVRGAGRINVAPAASPAGGELKIHLCTPELIILAGTIDEVSIESNDVQVVIEAEVKHVKVKEGMTGGRLEVASTSEASIGDIDTDVEITLTAEDEEKIKDIKNISTSAEAGLVCTEVVCKIDFETNGGDFDSVPPFMFITKGEAISKLPSDPIKLGNKFIGWNTEADGSGTSITVMTVMNGSIDAFAQWEEVVVLDGTYYYALEDSFGEDSMISSITNTFKLYSDEDSSLVTTGYKVFFHDNEILEDTDNDGVIIAPKQILNKKNLKNGILKIKVGSTIVDLTEK